MDAQKASYSITLMANVLGGARGLLRVEEPSHPAGSARIGASAFG